MATENTALAENEERTVSVQRSIYDPGYVNAMSHFYRGEMGRIMVWRQRLDVTSNWAITSTTAIITIAFSTREVPHTSSGYCYGSKRVVTGFTMPFARVFECSKRIFLSPW